MSLRKKTLTAQALTFIIHQLHIRGICLKKHQHPNMEEVSMEQQMQPSQGPQYLQPLYRANGWIKFVGVMSIIVGALSVLSISGIIIAWLPIWMGIILVSTSNLLDKSSRSHDEQALSESFEKMGKYFKLSGIFIIVMIILSIIGIIAAIMIPAIIGMQQGAM
jgi:hypothetical protein